MSIRPFEPKFMKVGVLTAALQELTPRAVRDSDPDRAIEEWIEFARELNAGYIDNMLHHDPAVRKKKHEFMLRVFDAAVLLGVDAVCGFVGRNQQRSMDENLVEFESHFVPLLQDARTRGLTYRVEQCPMAGWTTGDNWHNNIADTPGTWIALHRICEKHGVADQFRIHYDPSHAILMGQDTRSIFQFLKDSGYDFLIGGFHVKGQVIDAKGLAQWGYHGQTVE